MSRFYYIVAVYSPLRIQKKYNWCAKTNYFCHYFFSQKNPILKFCLQNPPHLSGGLKTGYLKPFVRACLPFVCLAKVKRTVWLRVELGAKLNSTKKYLFKNLH
jgi:hypothetical protein